jgi:Rrf2 family protein
MESVTLSNRVGGAGLVLMSINLVEIIQAPTAACDAPEAHNLLRMRISAKVDYALRACTELAVAGDGPTKGDRIAAAQAIPIKFLENILSELRNAGIVATQRGVEGGYWLARPAEEITLAEVMRALEGPLANVRGHRPETLAYEGSAKALVELWIAVRASLRTVLETTTVADLAKGELPPQVKALTADPEAWSSH